uniref:(northern house mosquito) hypothetical protein n=1 Tax=Culex pipiens TaxID=7175 RepID=A0A8D8KFF9_CULPI
MHHFTGFLQLRFHFRFNHTFLAHHLNTHLFNAFNLRFSYPHLHLHFRFLIHVRVGHTAPPASRERPLLGRFRHRAAVLRVGRRRRRKLGRTANVLLAALAARDASNRRRWLMFGGRIAHVNANVLLLLLWLRFRFDHWR